MSKRVSGIPSGTGYPLNSHTTGKPANPNMIPITREQIDAALLLLEHVDIAAANLVRRYLAQLESALRATWLGTDDESADWTWTWKEDD